jgi:hypothetical protein
MRLGMCTLSCFPHLSVFPRHHGDESTWWHDRHLTMLGSVEPSWQTAQPQASLCHSHLTYVPCRESGFFRIDSPRIRADSRTRAERDAFRLEQSSERRRYEPRQLSFSRGPCAIRICSTLFASHWSDIATGASKSNTWRTCGNGSSY